MEVVVVVLVVVVLVVVVVVVGGRSCEPSPRSAPTVTAGL